MQRLALLAFVLTAACGGSTATGEASLTGTNPPIKAAAAEVFTGPDAGGNKVMGWNILLYENAAGGECKSGTVSAKLGIYTNTPAGSKPEPLLTNGDSISITAEKPPTIIGSATANMGVNMVSNVVGEVSITDFRLSADAMHADYIKGSINAGGTDSNGANVSLMGDFDAPVCKDN